MAFIVFLIGAAVGIGISYLYINQETIKITFKIEKEKK